MDERKRNRQTVTYLKQIEVSVELGAFSVLQSFELSCDEHENVLDQKETHKSMSHTDNIYL